MGDSDGTRVTLSDGESSSGTLSDAGAADDASLRIETSEPPQRRTRARISDCSAPADTDNSAGSVVVHSPGSAQANWDWQQSRESCAAQSTTEAGWKREAERLRVMCSEYSVELSHLRADNDRLEGSLLDLASEKAQWSAERDHTDAARATTVGLQQELAAAVQRADAASKDANTLRQSLDEKERVIDALHGEMLDLQVKWRDAAAAHAAAAQRLRDLERDAADMRAAMHEAYDIARIERQRRKRLRKPRTASSRRASRQETVEHREVKGGGERVKRTEVAAAATGTPARTGRGDAGDVEYVSMSSAHSSRSSGTVRSAP